MATPETISARVAAAGGTGRWRRGWGLRLALTAVIGFKLILAGLWLQSSPAGAQGTPAKPASAMPKLAVRPPAAPSGHGPDLPSVAPPAVPAATAAGTAKAPVAGSGSPTPGGAAEAAVVAKATEPKPVEASRGEPSAPKNVEMKSLLDAVSRRQMELDARERELTAREERLQLFEKDVTAKVANLEELEKRLAGKAKTASAASDAAAESLGKVYAAMKPADAAPLLDHLDEATVLKIFGRMKEKQLGEILPLMSRDKAVNLTRSLADRSNP
jgi:flagellar motility protein MotE (MotC chaperone)